jgi:outer membrane protein assembly factor BamA
VTEALWEEHYSVQLPANFTAENAVFTLLPGEAYYYESITVEGLDAISEERLHRYFIAQGALYHRESSRVFTYANFERRIGRVLGALEDLGYHSARKVASDAAADDQTGAVEASVVIEQGPLHRVGSVQVLLLNEARQVEATRELDQTGELYTQNWEQDQSRLLRNEAFELGYPDARVRIEVDEGVANPAGEMEHAIRYKVEMGPHVTLTGVRFEGDEVMQRTVLNDRIDLETGAPLNLLEVREARRRLMGLGVFREVDVSYDPEEGAERDVVYTLVPGLRKELRLLGGWGSYEQARVGMNWEQRNPWGRAHRYNIGLKKSMKTTEADATYSIPQVLGTDITGYVNAEHRFREEVSYDYTTQGVAFGASTYLTSPGILLTAEYGLANEDADRDDDELFESNDSAIVASVLLRASFDRRNNFLEPSSGYHIYGSYKFANKALGGSVNFQKLEGGFTYHLPLTRSTILHLGTRVGAIYSADESSSNIPFVERFFNGGEDTVRGYGEGEASPLDENASEIGAEAYFLTNVEIEQRVLSDLSVVLFYDGVNNSRDGVFEGNTEYLYSVGLGVRYQTVVGPVRLEYGYNPDPRDEDPDATLHLSVGFPF